MRQLQYMSSVFASAKESIEALKVRIDLLRKTGDDADLPKIALLRAQRSALFDFNQFYPEIREKLDKINEEIFKYNALKDSKAGAEEKIFQLKNIYLLHKALHAENPISMTVNFPAYRQDMHVEFITDLQKECNELGISLCQLTKAPKSTASTTDDAPLIAKLLANMSYNKVDELTKILSQGGLFDHGKLMALYEGEDTEEAAQFNDFFSAEGSGADIEFLGGINSKIFKINMADGQCFTLKVENLFFTSKKADFIFRDTQDGRKILSPVYAEREGAYLGTDGALVPRTLLITSFSKNGNVEADATKHHLLSDKISAAVHIFSEMAQTLQKIQDSQLIFPDMKNSNWLIDDTGHLTISDTKSIIFNPDDERASLIQGLSIVTDYLKPPESIKAGVSGDKLHVYMLGKNLYRYLTQASEESLHSQHNFKEADFNYPIFETEKGLRLKALIQGMVQLNPEDRINLDSALQELLVLDKDDVMKLVASREQTDHFKRDLPHPLPTVDTTEAADISATKGSLVKPDTL